jgi:hypothetical protein
VQKANALHDLQVLAIELRDNEALWLDPVVAHEERVTRGAGKSRWEEIGTRDIGGEEALICSFRKPMRGQPGVHATLELRLTLGGLVLTFSRLSDPVRGNSSPPRVLRRRPRPSPSTRSLAFNRRQWSALRSLRRRLGAPPSGVLLVPDDAELRALVALRCVQQDHYAGSALRELRGYALALGVPDTVMDDVLGRVVERFVTVHRPRALQKYVGDITWTLQAKKREAKLLTGGSARGEMMTVPEAAHLYGVPRRTMYHWVRTGVLAAAESQPYRVAADDLARVLKEVPGVTYRKVMELRECNYDAARMWVRRRLDKGISFSEIIKEAEGAYQPEESTESLDETGPETDVKRTVRQERAASLRRQGGHRPGDQ